MIIMGDSGDNKDDNCDDDCDDDGDDHADATHQRPCGILFWGVARLARAVDSPQTGLFLSGGE